MIQELTEKIKVFADAPLEVRLQEFAQSFLGTAYGTWLAGSSLESLDDFNYQLDILDCVTYVEVVLALAKTSPDADFIDSLRKLHYKSGVPNFINRNHFMSLDWIPNNSFAVLDITTSLSKNFKVAKGAIDKLNWLKVTKQLSEVPKHLLEETQAQQVELPYIETLELLDNQPIFFSNMPEYSIVNIVRPNWDLTTTIGTHLHVSHLGFLFKDYVTHTLRFYHATVTTKKVDTIDFCEYMAQYIESPTIRGFNVLSINPGYF